MKLHDLLAVTETKLRHREAEQRRRRFHFKHLRIVEANRPACASPMVLDRLSPIQARLACLRAFRSRPPKANRYDMKSLSTRGMLLGEPIIEALDDANVSATVRRTRGTSWEVLAASRAQLLAASGITRPPSLACSV
jgi:hypothetical protein